MNIRARDASDNPKLTEIWLASVRATHSFLTEDDIQFYHPLVRNEYLPAVDVWVSETETGEPAGFIGLSESKVEMLFVDPAHHGRGHGRQLLAFASQLRGPLTLDVNEQNPGALAFYRKCGFVDVGRSELDGSGKPFPLIHMAQRGD
ncbi:acetyltransferase [Pseudaminobacter soli (ex Li et al. 2025)]|uniref:Acetyltransferase n=1 Tax=Pseudaminobacter soli (ex Li et al. 2025) TaxID=1295366 RepID=A0A2P7SBQ9_9HYPH|nr:acetyltransferase [Mesorhizobium soli]PSJ59954.1 acetyltransferase [Mesorhizobium soli]